MFDGYKISDKYKKLSSFGLFNKLYYIITQNINKE